MKNKNFLFKIFFPFVVLLWCNYAIAANSIQMDYPEVPGKQNIFNTGRIPLLPAYTNYMLGMLIMVSGAIIFFVSIKAGFKYFTSRGSGSAISEAKNDIIAAFIGLFLLLSSYLILNFISPNYTTLTLDTQTIGIILSNGGEEDLLVSSGNKDLSSYLPAQITISKEYYDKSEITLYSEKNYTGSIYRIKKADWQCNENDCSFTYPIEYRKGSITVLILRPGVFVYKNKKIPLYVGKDNTNLLASNEFINIEGMVDGIRIYNSGSSNFGALTFIDSNYSGPGVLYFPPKKEGWASEDIIDLQEIESIKIFNARSINKNLAEFFYAPEYDYETKCAISDDTIRNIPFQKINCGFNEFVYSLKANRAIVALISVGSLDNPGRLAKCLAYTASLPTSDYTQPFCFAELLKVSDPNMDDNPEIGQCVCAARAASMLWCINWQSCATHALIIAQ